MFTPPCSDDQIISSIFKGLVITTGFGKLFSSLSNQGQARFEITIMNGEERILVVSKFVLQCPPQGSLITKEKAIFKKGTP